MKQPFVASIVEGQGEEQALGGLLRRIAATVDPGLLARVNPPIRVKSGAFIHDESYLSKYVRLAGAKAAQENGFVLIMLDSEDYCPAELGPSILEKARKARPDVPIVVTLAYREYETWFVAAAKSLRGHRGLPQDLMPPSDPEAFRDAKGWLGKHMPSGYDPVIDQAAFTHSFSFCEAAKNPSFRRLLRRVRSQFRAMMA